jgi:hypothetical protein
MNTLFMKRRQRDAVADEFRARTAECCEIAERHGDLIKEQYEALARQWPILAAQRIRTV